MRRGRFLKNNGEDNDPMSGMANLFDLAMVFAVALMVALGICRCPYGGIGYPI